MAGRGAPSATAAGPGRSWRVGARRHHDVDVAPAGLQGGGQYATVVYLDADVPATTNALTPFVEERWHSGAVRPLFAGPLRSMIQWEAWPE